MRDTPIIHEPEADYSALLEGVGDAKPQRGRRYKNGIHFLDLVCAFDIETSTMQTLDGPQSFMYIWQFQLGERATIIGRTWAEFLHLVGSLTQIAGDRKIICFVHNLSYEFQFLWSVCSFEPDDVFATDARDVLFCKLGCLELRCSLRLTNLSLAMWTDKMKVDHQKLPDYDYGEVRFPWTPVTGQDLQYCVNDVVGLVECAEAQMKQRGDTIYSIPYTSTGYIRRLARRALYWRRKMILNIQNDLPTYKHLREAYRGGDTHASRYYSEVLLEKVYSFDRSSSYPDVICHCKFPMTRFQPVEDPSLAKLDVYQRGGYCWLAKVRMARVQVKVDVGDPYIPMAKCREPGFAPPLHAEEDNGRILAADYLEIAITDIDWKIIVSQYDFEKVKIEWAHIARYGRLPQELIDLCIDLYRKKTALKGTDQQDEYQMSKELLNSIYGMMCERVIRTKIIFDHGRWIPDPKFDEKAAYDEAIQKAFLSYAWGVWVTAWARYRLHEGINLCSRYGFVYCDTDSVKTLDDINVRAYNEARIRDARRSGAYAVDAKGVTHYMGVLEYEGCYDRFKTLGAKRYAFEIGGELMVTIAGVPKKMGAHRLKELGGLEAFKDGVIFDGIGKTLAYYNDTTDEDFLIDGHLLHIGSNLVIEETSYSLILNETYVDLVKRSREYLDSVRYKRYNMLA